jgi:methylmalonyl-CoA mutase N-terminal domain/subunit
MGGMVAAIEAGFPQREIADSAYRDQQAVDRGERIIVGVNGAAGAAGPGIATLYIDDAAGRHQLARLADVRAQRDTGAVEKALGMLATVAQSSENTMPALLDAVRAYATVGEMCAVLRKTWGEYTEVPII